jgi:hypothetical protein
MLARAAVAEGHAARGARRHPRDERAPRRPPAATIATRLGPHRREIAKTMPTLTELSRRLEPVRQRHPPHGAHSAGRAGAASAEAAGRRQRSACTAASSPLT